MAKEANEIKKPTGEVKVEATEKHNEPVANITVEVKHTGVKVPSGHILLSAIDADGKLVGSAFLATIKTYQKVYTDETRFVVLKTDEFEFKKKAK